MKWMRLLVLTTLATLVATVSAVEEKRYWDSVFPVNPTANFELNSHKGFIKVGHADVREITVKATYYFQDASDDPALLEYLSFKTRATADTVNIDVEFEPPKQTGSGWWSDGVNFPYVEFDILLPSSASLELDTHKSEIDVDAPSGEVEIESHKGTGIIRGVRNNLEIESHKGQFTVEVDELHDIEIETHKGDITVNVRNASHFTMVGTSNKGDFSFSGRNIPVTIEDRSSYVNYSEGHGGNKIDLETHKGRITLNFKD